MKCKVIPIKYFRLYLWNLVRLVLSQYFGLKRASTSFKTKKIWFKTDFTPGLKRNIARFKPDLLCYLELIQVSLCQMPSRGPCLWPFSHHLQKLTCNKNSTKPINRLTVYPQ